MYEHPYFSQSVAEFERLERESAAERRRFLREHADQIVPRQAGAVRRWLRRVTPVRRTATADAPAAARPVTSACEPATAR